MKMKSFEEERWVSVIHRNRAINHNRRPEYQLKIFLQKKLNVKVNRPLYEYVQYSTTGDATREAINRDRHETLCR